MSNIKTELQYRIALGILCLLYTSMAYRSCRAYSYFLMRIRCSIWLEGLYYYMER